MLKELAELEQARPLEAVFVCDTSFARQARSIMKAVPCAVSVRTIPSGKLRRYAHFSWWQYLRHFSIVLHNVADVFKIAAGFFAALWLMVRFRPDVVFAKGGFVCLPVGYAARLCRVPLVIHDSDARPGLTSKLLAGFASAIGTGMPLENYDYHAPDTQYVGVPIHAAIRAVTPELQAEYRAQLGLPAGKRIVVAVGGSLGSVTINHATAAAAKTADEDVLFYNVTGVKNIEEAKERGKGVAAYQPVSFVYENMHKLLGAADVVVTRASATTLQELAGLQKAVIAVPARQLGDQQKNAELFAKYEAVVVLHDDELADELPGAVRQLLADDARRASLAARLHEFARPDAARAMAQMIVRTAATPSATIHTEKP